MEKIIIKPLNSKKENFYLSIFILSLISVAAILIGFNKRAEYKKNYKNYQLDVYSLEGNISGVYTDLVTAYEEIGFLYEDFGYYPSIDELEEEYIAPFVRDMSWKNRGQIEWKVRIEEIKGEEVVHYIGNRGDTALILAIEGPSDARIMKVLYTTSGDVDKLGHWEDMVKWGYYELTSYEGDDLKKELGRG